MQADFALLARLQANPGKEAEVEKFLVSVLPLAKEESATGTWFALRLNKSTFGVFDTFANEDGRQAHLSGKIASALMQKAPELLATDPIIEKVDILAAKLP